MVLKAISDQILDVSGALTIDAVPGIYLESQSLINSKTGTIDLAGVTSVDSAGLALLLEWQAAAQGRGANLAFINAPSDLLRLAALSESSDLLGLKARPGE